MNPDIKRYLDEHGATYTPEALRKGLVEAGHDPTAVDADIREWQAGRSGGEGSNNRGTFRRWAILLHLGALVATLVVLLLMKGMNQAGVILLGVGVLAVAMLIGWAISSMIGRALLPGTGLTIALVVPAISAVALAGTCFAMLQAAIPTPATDGSVHLEIVAPLTFSGTAEAACYVRGGSAGVQVLSHGLGTIDGDGVRLDVYWYPAGHGPAAGADLSISIDPESTQGRFYTVVPGTEVTVEASQDGRTGSVEFDGLAREPRGPDDTDLELSGSATWTCE